MRTTFFLQAAIVGLLTALWCNPAHAGDKQVQLLNGKDLAGWKVIGGGGKSGWVFGTAKLDPTDPTKLTVEEGGAELVTCEKGANLATEEKFGDCRLEMEFMLSKNSNAGVKMMNIYEIQLLDSYGKARVTDTDCGAVYKESAPKVNASRKPGEWQKLIIDFRAPRFDASGKKTADAKFVKVVLNGEVVQENFPVPHGTNVSKNAKEHPLGPIYLQGDHGPVAFRNLQLTRLD